MKHSLLHSLLLAGTGLAAAGAVITAAFSVENAGTAAEEKSVQDNPKQAHDDFYRQGDWYTYALSPEYRLPSDQENSLTGDFTFDSESSAALGGVYGRAWFTHDKYRLFDEDRPVSRVIGSGFVPSNDIKIMLQGHAGKKMTVYIDHDSKRESADENIYRMQYRAVNDDEVVREINAGDIDVKMDGSHYALYDGRHSQATGIEAVLKKGPLSVKGFASVAKGGDDTELFSGTSSASYCSVAEYQFIRNTYFQIEPYARYDGIYKASAVVFPAAYSMVVFTSKPADPKLYMPYAVRIEAGSAEIWVDEQSAVKNPLAQLFPPDGGSYIRFAEGSDFVLNYMTGQITFKRSIPDTARIIAAYRLEGGSLSSCDPSAHTGLIAGKIAVYIKYGTQIEEDSDHNNSPDGDYNSDGRINHDIYEIRSAYMIGDTKILPDRFTFTLYNTNRTSVQSERDALGNYTVDFTTGILFYNLREPFRALLDLSSASVIYGSAGSNFYEVSSYSQRFDYTRNARSFQLKHMNIIEGSVTVKINGSVLSPSLYAVNALSGTVEFLSPDNPVLTDSTPVEINYQYTQQGLASKGFTGGLRGDYRFNEIFSGGGSFLFNRSNTANIIPQQGEEPTQNLVFEGDASLTAGPAKFGRLADMLTGGYADTLPVSLKGYAEYARSIYYTNTFGKMLIDDMESDAQEASVSMSERDWILSSMPAAQLQSNRAMLLYKYYRDLSSAEVLRGLSFAPYAVPYSTRPGPYNIADGHMTYSTGEKNSDRRSLVFDADFSSGQYAAAVTRIGDGKGTDLSGLQYVEIWYRSAGGSGSVELSVDIGGVNEDSDGDNVYDTEDGNRNGYLDRDPQRGIDEDTGYSFNPSGGISTRVGGGPNLNAMTRGDGTLTTEDTNGNGMLDTAESVLSFPGACAWADTDSANTPLTVPLSDTSWKKARIYLQRKSLAESDKSVLRNARSIRLVLHSAGATAAVIHIDALRLVSSRWKDIYINGISNEDSSMVKTGIIDTIHDLEYRGASFLLEKKDEFTSMYGERTSGEINDELESALSLTYLFSSANFSVSRFFQKPLDLRRYHTMSLWLNARELSAGDSMRIQLCTTDVDYTEYTIPLDGTMNWKEVLLKLDGDSGGNIAPSAVAGFPDRGLITKMKIFVYGGPGRIWVNSITAREPYTLTGNAYFCESTIDVQRPLYITENGTALMKSISFSALRRSHDGNYTSPGRTDLGQSDTANEFRTSVEIIPGLRSAGSAVISRQHTDSFDSAYSPLERGDTSRNQYGFNTEYSTGLPSSPLVMVAYNGEQYENCRSDFFGQTKGELITGRTVHSPKITYAQTLSDPFSGKWSLRAAFDNSFASGSISRRASGTVTSGDQAEIEARDTDQRQKNDLNLSGEYSYAHLYLAPSAGLFSHEIVSCSGSSLSDGGIIGSVQGSYHIPFFNDDAVRYVERTVQSGFRWGVKDYNACAFSDAYEFTYGQNLFKDYTAGEKTLYRGFTRQHGSTASASHTVSVPFFFNEPLRECLRSIGFNYSRKLSFSETGVPFEGEKGGWTDEQFGIGRSASALLPELYNYYAAPPWKYFTGRGNFASGRDHVNSLENTPLAVSGTSVSGYGNSLFLTENASASAGFVFKGVTANIETSINQVCQRYAVLSLPGQQVTAEGGIELAVNIMDLFSFGFFRPNSGTKPFHAARWTAGYSFSRTMIITENIREDVHKPVLGYSMMWGKTSVTGKAGIDFRYRSSYPFIPGDADRSRADDPYYNAITHVPLKEKDNGYSFSIRYDTDLPFFYSWFMRYYQFTDSPLFSLEYALLLNRYDYSNAVSPEPYDQHLITGKLSFDMHKNVRGGITGRWALERWYNRETHGLYREVTSADIAFSMTLLF